MKTVSDNEIIDTSRGHKRIGAVFDENAMLRASNAELQAALIELTAQIEEDFDIQEVGGEPLENLTNIARAAIARARGQE